MKLDPLELAQDLIKFPSVTPDSNGVTDYMERILESLGFQVWREVFHEEGTPSVENLYAKRGNDAPNFCYAGHLDVVPVGDESAWSVDPFEAIVKSHPNEQGDHLYGRGAEDMKGAIAAFIAAISRFPRDDAGKKGSISLLITMDEEGPGINGTEKMLKWLETKGEKIDICLVGEPTNPKKLGEMIKIGRRGSMNCVLKVKGKQGHAAYPLLADNPVTRIGEIVHRLNAESLDEGTAHFLPSNLEVTSIDVNNPAHNVIPAFAKAMFNVRFNDTRPADDIKRWIKNICDQEAPNHELSMTVTGEAFLTEPNRLTDIMQQVCKEITGIMPTLSTTGGTSDARFIKDYAPVVEFGTTGRTPHHVDENVAVQTLYDLTNIYEATLLRYFD